MNNLFIMYPSEDKAMGIPSVYSLKFFSDIIQSLIVSHSDFKLEVLVVVINSVHHHVAIDINIIDTYDGHGNHHVRFECN